MLDWFKKRRMLSRWKLMGILMFAVIFGMTLHNSMGSGNYGFPVAVFFCGIGFAYDK
tara:strand:+ start:15 stop:185 length:171 start_codon:yes stop_codon:yes gene_type:complete